MTEQLKIKREQIEKSVNKSSQLFEHFKDQISQSIYENFKKFKLNFQTFKFKCDDEHIQSLIDFKNRLVSELNSTKQRLEQFTQFKDNNTEIQLSISELIEAISEFGNPQNYFWQNLINDENYKASEINKLNELIQIHNLLNEEFKKEKANIHRRKENDLRKNLEEEQQEITNINQQINENSQNKNLQQESINQLNKQIGGLEKKMNDTNQETQKMNVEIELNSFIPKVKIFIFTKNLQIIKTPFFGNWLFQQKKQNQQQYFQTNQILVKFQERNNLQYHEKKESDREWTFSSIIEVIMKNVKETSNQTKKHKLFILYFFLSNAQEQKDLIKQINESSLFQKMNDKKIEIETNLIFVSDASDLIYNQVTIKYPEEKKTKQFEQNSFLSFIRKEIMNTLDQKMLQSQEQIFKLDKEEKRLTLELNQLIFNKENAQKQLEELDKKINESNEKRKRLKEPYENKKNEIKIKYEKEEKNILQGLLKDSIKDNIFFQTELINFIEEFISQKKRVHLSNLRLALGIQQLDLDISNSQQTDFQALKKFYELIKQIESYVMDKNNKDFLNNFEFQFIQQRLIK